MQNQLSLRILCALIVSLFFTSCAGVRTRPAGRSAEQWSAPEVLQQIKDVGSRIRSARGEVWMKVRSSDASGQFPATVVVENENTLRLEVTNLIGGTEALIQIQGLRYKIEVPDKKERNEVGTGSWGGIPLEWATLLFLGRIPVPLQMDPKMLSGGEQLHWNPQSMELSFSLGADLKGGRQTFLYRMKQWGERLWPEALTWERQNPALPGARGNSVEFKFEDPDDSTFAPKRWEASSPQGLVKVRWKVREQIDR